MDPTHYKIIPEPELTQLAAQSAEFTRQTSVGDPSFNQQAAVVGGMNGYAKANRWLVMIMPNSKVSDFTGMRRYVDIPRLATTCKSVTLADQSWFTTEQANINAGATRLFPYKRNSNNTAGIRMQFNVTADMFEKEFFEKWMQYIQDPVTKGFRYYDDYALGSDIYVIALPNRVANFYEAYAAVFSEPSRITGYRFTEAYPYILSLNGNALNYQVANEPLYMDVAMMYHDITPLDEIKVPESSFLVQVGDTGFPYINGRWAESFLQEANKNYERAFEGHIIGQRQATRKFAQQRLDQVRQNDIQRQTRESYAMTIQQPDFTLPRAVDGLVQYPAPNNSALNFGLTVLSQVQGFFGAGFLGNGFNL
jgi:hypothetical protein